MAETKEKERKPVAAVYCATFLAQDMRHIYRQVTGMLDFQPHVITRKRLNADAFPMHKKWITSLSKSKLRFFRRLWFKQLRKLPVPMTTVEVREALYAVQKHDARVLHVYFGNIAVQLLPLIKTMRGRWPVVVSFHGADAGVDTENAEYRAQLREVFASATLVLARSESLLARLRELGCPGEKLRLQRTGIPLGELPFVERTPPPDGAWRFLQACRLVEKKGLPVALEAFAKVRDKYPKAEFVIAGNGPLQEALVALAKKLGIADSVRLPGFMDMQTLLTEMHRAHVFLHPSQTPPDGNREGVPNAMLEAMATGLPAVATRHGGIPEVIIDGENGLLVDERDVDALTQKTLALVGNPKTYARLSAASHTTVVEKFSDYAQMAALEGHYREAAGMA